MGKKKKRKGLAEEFGLGNSIELDKMVEPAEYGHIRDFLKEKVNLPKQDRYLALRHARNRKERERLINEMRIDDRMELLRGKLEKLPEKERETAKAMIEQIETNPHKGESEVILEYSEASKETELLGEKIEDGEDGYRMHVRLLRKAGWFGYNDRQLPKIYIGSKAAIRAIGTDLNQRLREAGLDQKERWTLIGEFYKNRVDGNEVLWQYKTDESLKLASRMLEKLRLDLIRKGYSKKDAESRVSNFNVTLVANDPNFNSSKYVYPDILKILQMKSARERKEELENLRKPDLDMVIHESLMQGVKHGYSINGRFIVKLYGLPYFSRRAAFFGFKNQRKKLVKQFMKEVGEDLVRSGTKSRKDMLREAARFADREIGVLNKRFLHYPRKAGTASYHIWINTKGNIYNRKRLPDEESLSATVQTACKNSVEEHGGMYIYAAPDSKTRDHVHVAFELNPDFKLTDQVRKIKERIKQDISKEYGTKIAWSGGFGFEAGRGSSRISKLINYLRKNEQAKYVSVEEVKDVLASDHEHQTKEFLNARRQAFKNQGARCKGCGRNLKGIQYHGHHRTPRAKGGSDRDIEVLCPECHRQTDSYGRKA